MRPLLAFLLCVTLFVSTSIAQTGLSVSLPPPKPAQVTLASPLPSVLYECEADECEKPNSGGGLWLFEDKAGQSMWKYGAVAGLTVEEFDGHSIHIHRVDPAGTYSSQFNGGKEFFADYFGTITGDKVEGKVYWAGTDGWSPWRATIVSPPASFCADEKCPLEPHQLSILGRRASEAKLYGAAYHCFRLAASEHDPDGEGFFATMVMNGFGQKMPAEEILRLLQDSASHDSYAGEKGLAQAYDEGVIVAKDARQAAYWSDRATTWRARKEAEENAEMQGRVMSTALIIGLLLGVMSGAGSGSSGQAGAVGIQHGAENYDWYSHGGAFGGPPPGWHSDGGIGKP